MTTNGLPLFAEPTPSVGDEVLWTATGFRGHVTEVGIDSLGAFLVITNGRAVYKVSPRLVRPVRAGPKDS